MCNENYASNGSRHEAAGDVSSAASATGIINREKSMSKVWPFLGGIIIGAASVVTAALVADRITFGEVGMVGQRENVERLALPACRRNS